MSDDISETYTQICMKLFLIHHFTAQYMDTYNLQKLHDFQFGFQFAYAITLWGPGEPVNVNYKCPFRK